MTLALIKQKKQWQLLQSKTLILFAHHLTKKSFKHVIFVYVRVFANMYVYIPTMCAMCVPVDPPHLALQPALWVLGIEPKSSAIACSFAPSEQML